MRILKKVIYNIELTAPIYASQLIKATRTNKEERFIDALII